MTDKKIIARITDTNGPVVTFLSGPNPYTVDWPGDAPTIGDVYAISLEPHIVVHEKLATPMDGIEWPKSDTLRWRTPRSDNKTRMDILHQRHIIKRALRDYLHGEGFIEIDMPLLVPGTTPDAEIDSFAVDDRYLVTSCEYQIKRMEIGGFDRIYTLTQNFRVGDRGRFRNPEFTMIEWSRVGQDLNAIESDAEQFLWHGHAALGGGNTLHYQGHMIDITPPWDRLSVRGAIEKYIGVSVDDFSATSLLKAAEKAGLAMKPEWHNDSIFLFSLVLEHLQQKLGFEKPVFLTEWPKLMTASADIDQTGKFTQRSELFIAGVELSDGFPSLTDYARQKDGFQQQIDRRHELGHIPVQIDTKFVESLREGFPRGAGMALGFDRLVMILTDRPSIDDVLSFNWDEL